MNRETFLNSALVSLVPLGMLLVFGIMYAAALKLVVICEPETGRECITISQVYSAIPAPAEPVTTPDLKHRENVVAKLSGQFIWLFFAGLNVLCSILGLAAFAAIVNRWQSWRRALFMILVSLAIGFICAVYDGHEIIATQLLETIKTGAGGLPNILRIELGLNGLCYSLVLAMGLTMSVILANKTTTPSSTDKSVKEKENKKTIEIDADSDSWLERVEVLTEKRKQLKFILYFLTVNLILTLLRVNSGFNWALSFIPAETTEITAGLLTTLTVVLGGFFSILLASTYVPAAYIIHERARIVLKTSNEYKEGEEESEMEKKGFKFSFYQALPRILAIIAPLLTGSIATLVNAIANVMNK